MSELKQLVVASVQWLVCLVEKLGKLWLCCAGCEDRWRLVQGGDSVVPTRFGGVCWLLVVVGCCMHLLGCGGDSVRRER